MTRSDRNTMSWLRRIPARILDAVVAALVLFFVYAATEPELWDGPVGIAWLAVLGVLCLSFAVAIAVGSRRRRS